MKTCPCMLELGGVNPFGENSSKTNPHKVLQNQRKEKKKNNPMADSFPCLCRGGGEIQKIKHKKKKYVNTSKN